MPPVAAQNPYHKPFIGRPAGSYIKTPAGVTVGPQFPRPAVRQHRPRTAAFYDTVGGGLNEGEPLLPDVQVTARFERRRGV